MPTSPNTDRHPATDGVQPRVHAMSTRHMILNLFFYNPQGITVSPGVTLTHQKRKYLPSTITPVWRAQGRSGDLDAIFVADHIAVWDTVPSGLTHYANARLEPLTLLSALAAVTEHIGLMATASTSYNEPYNLARYFASLDFLSNGRASWNVVTSWLEEEAANFGLEQLPRHGNPLPAGQ